MAYTHIDLRRSAQQKLADALARLRTEFDLPDGFPPAVLDELRTVLADHKRPALDYTDLPFLTIDPAGATDLDQAMFLERSDEGYFVRYAIADVPSFVPPGGALDAEARRRGQTIYVPNGRIPMHPEEMSEGAASLLPGQERSAFVWELSLDADAELRSIMVQRARISSIAQLDYDSCQRYIDGRSMPEADGPVLATLQLLKEIGRKREQLERARGGANLNVPDQQVEFDGVEYTLSARPPLQVESWNAQISLLTGMAAAQLMLEGKVGILRTMPDPDPSSVQRYRLQTVALGKPWDEGVPYGEYLRSLDTKDPRQLALMHAASSLFRGAGYTPFDGELPQQRLQAAVAAPYTHTTAPLRRLVDRFVLVICEALCAGTPVPDWAREALPQLPVVMAASDQLAARVDRAAIGTVEAALLSTHVGSEFDAVVIAGPRRNGNGNGANGNGSGANGNGGNGNGNGTAGNGTAGSGNGNGKAGNATRGTVQITEPPVTAPCEGDLEAGTRIRVRLLSADIATRTVLFTAVSGPGIQQSGTEQVN